MATITQEIELYRRILELLEPLGGGVFGRGAGMIGRSGKSGLAGAVFPRELGATIQRIGNGRFLYTDLGSLEQFGGIVSGPARGDSVRGSIRNTGALGGYVSGVARGDSIRGAGNTLRMLGMLGMPETLGIREVGSVRSAVNYRNRGTEAARTAYGGFGGQNAFEGTAARYGESSDKQLNGGQVSWAGDILAPIDRSWNLIAAVSERISGMRGERNTVSEKIRTGDRAGRQNAVFVKDTREAGQTEKAEYAGKIREDIGTGSGSPRKDEDGAARADMPRARNGADEVIERLCGALREAAFSMSEGVHY